jgi:uncharacterized protein
VARDDDPSVDRLPSGAVFVDTSAFVAVLVEADQNHRRGSGFLVESLQAGITLVSSQPVVFEATAVLQARFGFSAARMLHDNLLPAVSIVPVDPGTSRRSVVSWRAARRRPLSLVDCTSFELMRDLALRLAFAYDPHFAEEGFELVG